MRKIIFFVITLGIFFLIAGCSTSKESKNTDLKNDNSANSKLKVTKSFDTIEELSNDSKHIVMATIGVQKETITKHGVDFIITEITIDKNIKGKLPKNINLLQTVSNEDPIVKKGTKTLLYLEEYVGPLAENVYVCVGLGAGQYKIKGTKLEPSIKLNPKLEKSFKKNQYIKNIEKHIKE